MPTTTVWNTYMAGQSKAASYADTNASYPFYSGTPTEITVSSSHPFYGSNTAVFSGFSSTSGYPMLAVRFCATYPFDSNAIISSFVVTIWAYGWNNIASVYGVPVAYNTSGSTLSTVFVQLSVATGGPSSPATTGIGTGASNIINNLFWFGARSSAMGSPGTPSDLALGKTKLDVTYTLPPVDGQAALYIAAMVAPSARAIYSALASAYTQLSIVPSASLLFDAAISSIINTQASIDGFREAIGEFIELLALEVAATPSGPVNADSSLTASIVDALSAAANYAAYADFVNALTGEIAGDVGKFGTAELSAIMNSMASPVANWAAGTEIQAVVDSQVFPEATYGAEFDQSILSYMNADLAQLVSADMQLDAVAAIGSFPAISKDGELFANLAVSIYTNPAIVLGAITNLAASGNLIAQAILVYLKAVRVGGGYARSSTLGGGAGQNA